MNNLFRRMLVFPLIFILTACAFFVRVRESRADGGPCQIAVTKIARGGEGQIFNFQVEVDGSTGGAEFIGGVRSVVNLDFGPPVTLTELPNPGWKLVDKSCQPGPGVIVTDVDGGFILQCVALHEGVVQAECTFVNQSTTVNIPTLSEWGMISAAAGLGLIGIFFAVRKRRTTAA